MKNKLSILVLSFIASIAMQAQTYTPAKENLEARTEFQDMKLGMFVHWTPASVLGAGQWVMNKKNISIKDYSRLINIFNPQNFDAQKWVATAKSGGMKYITFTTRHHDGFSNWDTKQSEWKITNTPYGKDVLKQLADECHKEGIKLFCYYSLVDWYHPDYQYETSNSIKDSGRTIKSNWENYILFMKEQLTELLTNYGKIDGIWLDGNWDQWQKEKPTLPSRVNWHYDELYQLIHSLQPQCMIANNHHLAPFPGEDFQAFEKDLPGENKGGFGGLAVSKLPLETCATTSDNWGFNITDTKYKSTKELLHFLINAAGKNANFLLNVGPMPDGTIQPEFVNTFKEIGDWVKVNGETIYGTRGSLMDSQDWGVITTKGKTWYAHILKAPKPNAVILIPNMKEKIKKCVLFENKKPLKFKQTKEGIMIDLNGITLNEIDTIIEIQLR